MHQFPCPDAGGLPASKQWLAVFSSHLWFFFFEFMFTWFFLSMRTVGWSPYQQCFNMCYQSNLNKKGEEKLEKWILWLMDLFGKWKICPSKFNFGSKHMMVLNTSKVTLIEETLAEGNWEMRGLEQVNLKSIKWSLLPLHFSKWAGFMSFQCYVNSTPTWNTWWSYLTSADHKDMLTVISTSNPKCRGSNYI